MRYAPARPRSDPSAAPIRRFSVILRTCSSKKTTASPKTTPIAAPRYGVDTPKGLRNQAAQPSSAMKRVRSKSKSFTGYPHCRFLTQYGRPRQRYSLRIEYITDGNGIAGRMKQEYWRMFWTSGKREWRGRRGVHPSAMPGRLENFGEFFSERAVRTLVALVRALVLLSAALTPDTVSFAGRMLRDLRGWLRGAASHRRSRCRRRLLPRFGRLCLVSAQETIFKRSAVEPADDGGHLFRIRRVDEGEPL